MIRNLLIAPLNILCSKTLLKNHDLEIDKNLSKKTKKTALLLMAYGFYESNLQYQKIV